MFLQLCLGQVEQIIGDTCRASAAIYFICYSCSKSSGSVISPLQKYLFLFMNTEISQAYIKKGIHCWIHNPTNTVIQTIPKRSCYVFNQFILSVKKQCTLRKKESQNGSPRRVKIGRTLARCCTE